MVNTGVKVVSTYDIFPLVRIAMSEGKKVKITVSGNSMEPWISHNRDQVLLSAAAGRNLKKGNIILFQSKYGKYILHRIYKTDAEGYHTIGDACLSEDGFILPSEIIGVVEIIYRKGKEIDCDSFHWRFIFTVWRRLLPFRKYLLNFYFLMRKLKRRMNITIQSFQEAL